MNADKTIVHSGEPSVRWMVPFCTRELTALFSAMLEAAGYPKGGGPVLELSFVDDGAMAALNIQTMGCTGPTNVLSFPSSAAPLQDNSPGEERHAFRMGEEAKDAFPELGLLVVAPSTVLRECFLYGQESEEHFIRLFAHGLAHLMGHDHGPAMDSLCLCMERAGRESMAADF